jgi:hypothetical protein
MNGRRKIHIFSAERAHAAENYLQAMWTILNE